MQLVFFKKPVEALIKSKRVYVRASSKGRRRKAYYRVDPRNKKPESAATRRTHETYEMEVPSGGAYSTNEIREAIGTDKGYELKERGGNIVISSPSNDVISKIRSTFVERFDHQPDIKTIHPVKKEKGLSREERISQPGSVSEYSGIKFRREGPGKFVPVRGQKIKKKTLEKVKKELRHEPEAKILGQMKRISDTHRNLLSYFRGRQNNTIVETTPAPKLNEVTPKDIMSIRLDSSGQQINRFIFDNDDFSRKMAWKLYDAKLSEKIGFDDLAQMARLGMHQAIEKFDVKRKFDTAGGFVNYMKKAMLNNMVYMKNLYLKRSIEGLKNPLSLDTTFANEGEEAHEREMYESIPSQYAGPRSIEFAEFKSTISAMKRKIKNENAKKILDLMASQYGDQSAIAKKLKMSRMTVNKLVARHIKPIAKQYLQKSQNKYLIRFLKSLEEPMKLVFFLKSKRVYVPSAKGKKAYWRTDPRSKKAKEDKSISKYKNKIDELAAMFREANTDEEVADYQNQAKDLAKKMDITNNQMQNLINDSKGHKEGKSHLQTGLQNQEGRKKVDLSERKKGDSSDINKEIDKGENSGLLGQMLTKKAYALVEKYISDETEPGGRTKYQNDVLMHQHAHGVATGRTGDRVSIYKFLEKQAKLGKLSKEEVSVYFERLPKEAKRIVRTGLGTSKIDKEITRSRREED